MFRMTLKQDQIRNPIIGTVSVPMMNYLSLFKNSPKMSFHYDAVFSELPAFVFCGMFRRVNHKVAITERTALPISGVFPFMGFHKMLFVNLRKWFALFRLVITFLTAKFAFIPIKQPILHKIGLSAKITSRGSYHIAILQ